MKRIVFILISLSIFLTACSKEEKKQEIDLVGQWELTDIMEVRSAQIGTEVVKIYIDFKEDQSMTLWQKIGAGRFVEFNGKWSLSEDQLSGVYIKDNKESDWGSTYTVSIDNDVLQMKEEKRNSEIYTYKRCSIPQR